MKEKVNCWEYKNCGRNEGGNHVHDMGICPSAEEQRLDGVHGGINGGRACWVISGTLCRGEVQGTFAQKFKSCLACDFYRHVKQDEHPNFSLSAALLKRLG